MRCITFGYTVLFIGLLFPKKFHAQQPALPSVPTTAQFVQYANIAPAYPTSILPSVPTGLSTLQQQQNASIISDVSRMETARQNSFDVQRDIEEVQNKRSVSYTLPSYSSRNSSRLYYEAFDRIIQVDTTYSLKETTFLIENAYFDNKLDKAAFEKMIKEGGDFITAKMREQGYNLHSNTAKNFLLFQFFAEPLTLKATKQKHLPFKYDFDDYMGMENYSKMFVSKLLSTGSGQCHSMPLLYLILAEEIGAEAYLALSPNHSYIRFPDDNGKWFNIELTNGMFSTDSYILQSGYIKSEALQNGIYMQNLSKKELLANALTDLASGYIRKFGYDEFVGEVIERALSLYPNSVNAHILYGQVKAARFEYVMRQLGINPNDQKDLQRIKQYPQAIKMLYEVKAVFAHVDSLGYETMPEDVYQAWLQSMTKENQKQKNEELTKQLKGVISNNKNKVKG